jgi:hypothetical protein
MAEKIKLVQGDTRPQVQVTLTEETTGAIINLTGATVVMKFRLTGSTTVLDTLTGVITNAAGGQVVFAWNPGTLNVDPGDYEGEIQITFSSGEIQTVYDLVKFKLRQDF